MNVHIERVYSEGGVNTEFVELRVDADCDIGKYLIADSSYQKNGTVSNRLRHVYWFPDKKVKKGELVTLWTKVGDDQETTTNGTRDHWFYWNLGVAVWNDNADCAILIEELSRSFKRIRKAT